MSIFNSILKKQTSQQQQPRKMKYYKLYGTPYLLLDINERDNKLRELASILSQAERGYIYSRKFRSVYEFLGEHFDIVQSEYVLATEKDMNLEPTSEPQRPKLIREYDKYIETEQGFARVLVGYSFSTKIREAALSFYPEKITPKMFEVFLQFNKVPTSSIRNYLTSLEVKKARMSRYASASTSIEEMLTRSERLKKDIDELASDTFKFRVLIVVHTDTKQELDTATKEVVQKAQENGILLDIPCCAQGDLYYLRSNISYRYSSGISTAKLYPLAGTSLVEGDKSVFLGVDDKGNPIAIDYFASVNGRQNPHWCIIGTTGAGKTTSASALIYRSLKVYEDIYIFIIDPMANFNRFFEDLADLNIVFSDDRDLGLDPIRLVAENVVSSGNIADFITEQYGIPHELRGLLVSLIEQSKTLKELLENVEDFANKKSATEYRKLYNYLLNMVTGADKKIYLGEPIDLKGKKFVILGLKTEDARKKRIASALLMLYAYSMINRLPRDVKKVLLIDEAHFLFESEPISEIIALIYRTARALRTSMITMTQLIQHYKLNKYSDEAFKLANNKLLLKQERESAEDLKALAKASDEEIDLILKASRGKGILLSGNIRAPIQILLTEEEKMKWRTE
ncbi:ATP-binding protein [Sulfolobus tengchongensis]|uniref:ATP-binding protein n=1 Tax=Sulfolobus tengchongensis TaxID=207809 RepID=A0AAX4L0K4_9CREN